MLAYPQATWTRYQLAPLPYTVELQRLPVGTWLLAAAKEHLRVSGTAEDTLITRLLDLAGRALEDDCRRVLLTSTVKEYFAVWPRDYLGLLQLSRAPVASVTSVTYYDTADVLQTWDPVNYVADVLSEPARVVVAADAKLTSPNVDQRPNAVRVEYQAGYGSTAADLPAETINAIFVKVGYLYMRGRELGSMADADAVERCWQNEIRRLTWGIL